MEALMDLFLGPVAIWFGLPALVGTGFFLLRVLSMALGGFDAEAGADLGGDAGGGGGAGDGGGLDDVDASDQSFKVLSIQAIAGFLMGFGWGGLGALRGAGWPLVVSAPFAVACGLAMLWLLARLFKAVWGLQSSGTVALYHALGCEGSVYVGIPGDGKGEVRVIVGDRERYFAASSPDGELPRGARIRVTEVNEEDNTVTVVRA